MISRKGVGLIAGLALSSVITAGVVWLSNADIEPLHTQPSVANNATEAALERLERMKSIVARYYYLHGQPPDSLGDVIRVEPDGDLRGSFRVDPWEHEILFEWTGPTFVLRSVGPDGVQHTGDDIVVNASTEDPELTRAIGVRGG